MPKPTTEGPKRKASKPRKRPLPNDRDINGNIVGSKTSIASRKRRCPRVTLASLQIDDEDDDLSKFTTSFGINSHSHNTWGIPSSTTIAAPKRKQKAFTFKQQLGVSRNHAGFFNRFPGLRNFETTPEPVEIDCPSRSPFLRYPLDIPKPVLETFTIVLTPKKVGFSSTALGFEDNAITFSDFLWDGGEIMSAIMKLVCKKLRVVVKKDNGRRIILDVDVFGSIFATSDDHEDWFKEDRTQQLARAALRTRVRSELIVIKDKFEEIFNNEEKAIEMGWCRVMDSDERSSGSLS
ncbi:predicted protein [Sclerotinia sclerotiorum 1980 UF-70]|uniref:Uncharacterized protein n=1 Tax=Sclerotinia sclerotiorum (strain ATCC 18683 / 1980 / Ss-1) TaxID=665079 RepID=A7EL85_SCLS1|nr:predicted protein [Sclerotinia sclerotiorum 1980 UF-70]EDO03601.1 predicted protein [Sclerotinia sclerotiorum 1980 UF-70]